MTQKATSTRPDTGWVSVNQVAEYWSISRDSARRAITDQGIERRKVGRCVRIPREAMENLGTPVDGDGLDLDWGL